MCNGKFEHVINLKESGLNLFKKDHPDFEGAVCVEHAIGSSGVVRLKFKLVSGEDVLVLINA